MHVDVYDTYATAADGGLLHFDFYVLAGTEISEVERLIHGFVGGADPEIEAERRCANLLMSDPGILIVLKAHGSSLQPLRRTARRVA